MTAGRATLELDAQQHRLPEVMSFVGRFWADHALPPQSAFPFELSLEELYLNVAQHGVKHEGRPPRVVISLELDGLLMLATMVDDGKPFDPFSRKTPDLGADIDDRPVGGLGVHLVKEMMDELRYRFDGQRNLVQMAKVLRAS